MSFFYCNFAGDFVYWLNVGMKGLGKLVFSDNKATRNADNNTIHWQSDVVAIGVYGSYSATGNGNIDLVATKQ